MATVYDLGDVALLTATFTQGGVAVTPQSVSLTVLTPAAVSTTYPDGAPEVVITGTGVYTFSLALEEVGRYRWRWVSVGSGAAAGESYLMVRTRDVP